jgi:hypothetical protein
MNTSTVTLCAQWASAAMKGDVNKDNVVNVFDALAILRHAVGLATW